MLCFSKNFNSGANFLHGLEFLGINLLDLGQLFNRNENVSGTKNFEMI